MEQIDDLKNDFQTCFSYEIFKITFKMWAKQASIFDKLTLFI